MLRKSDDRQPTGTYTEGCLVLDIPALTPSPNTYNGRHWSHYRTLRKAWSWYIKAAVLDAACDALRWPRSRIHVTRVSQRRLDPDNAVASLKICLDSLRDAQVIVDDSPKHITLTVEQALGRPSRTVVEVRKI